MTDLREVLNTIRDRSKNDTELGNAFEDLVKIYLENDDTQIQQYSKIWTYQEWAKSHPSYSSADIGIDLVAQRRDGDGFAAVQCKFYQDDHAISKADIDSFISASASEVFTRLLLVDTSTESLGKNSKLVLDNIDKEWFRIQASYLDQSRIEWGTYLSEHRVRLRSKKSLRDHQIQALDAVKDGFKDSDRGKMIMACGTGKTFTSLRIAEEIAGPGKTVLYMVPSLSLMSQTIHEWKNDSQRNFTAFSACSDVRVGKRDRANDTIEIDLNDLAFPATTDARSLADQVSTAQSEDMTVIFSTYQSIDVISKAQLEYGLGEFDLVICDEAHRTTGATLSGEDESNFVRIHSNENVQAAKRLYMTATPRIFGERAKNKADDADVALASMDDESVFGKNFFYRGFGWAVENNLLTDYKVVVLAMDEGMVSERLQQTFLREGTELNLDDATKMIGCYKALAKVGFAETKEKTDNVLSHPMQRALAFCQNIKLSKLFAEEFVNVVEEYETSEDVNFLNKPHLRVSINHVDGTNNAEQRTGRLEWLRDTPDEDESRVLTNVRCLSEGVDVPSLDAIMFLHPRKSQIDVVQAVGRVMRKAEGKELGYVIIPITVAPGVDPATALNNNKKYEVVWQILNALRAHDERFDGTINRIGLGEDVSERLEIVGPGGEDELAATTAVVEDIQTERRERDSGDEPSILDEEEDQSDEQTAEGEQLAFVMSDLTQAIKAKIVEKCGSRDYWETWATDIADIAERHIVRINSIVLNAGTKEHTAFQAFLTELRDDLNPEISESDAVEMLAQHVVTKPVFDSLFSERQFTAQNAMSRAMELLLEEIYHHGIAAESDALERFYDSVQRRSNEIVTQLGRQTLITELYNRFFKNAFKATTEKLGIVYTPVEIVDFILQSVDDICRSEFDTALTDEGVHILDPFTGTGTFMTRLIESGLIGENDLKRKYLHELHANEIVLLAYYIAAINIESTYESVTAETEYESFSGLVLTDTFQLFEQERDMIADLLPDNSNRRTTQKNLNLTVVVGNPPYSMGQGKANDNNANVSYQNLDARIRDTYVHRSSAGNANAVFDSYIRAIRWASDRIRDKGVIGFITNAGWLDANSTGGLRASFSDEFSKILIFHLRGNMRSTEWKKEGGQIFGPGSQLPIAITFLVKNPESTGPAEIFFHDIGDSLKRHDKLRIIEEFGSIEGIKAAGGFQRLKPNAKHEWVNQSDDSFDEFMTVGTKKKGAPSGIFKNYSIGLKTGRDAFNINFSKKQMLANVEKSISFYNSEMRRYKDFGSRQPVEEFVTYDSTQISWDLARRKFLERGTQISFMAESAQLHLYRPFTKKWIYADRQFNQAVYQTPKLFPYQGAENLAICIAGPGSNKFSVIMADTIPSEDLVSKSQCFPQALYVETEFTDEPSSQLELLRSDENSGTKLDALNSRFIDMIRAQYKNSSISSHDIFFYLYAVLHSPEYRERYSANLRRELPRVPLVKDYQKFTDMKESGEHLSALHVGYESAEKYPVVFDKGDPDKTNISNAEEFFRVEKMQYGGVRKSPDRTRLIYNHNIEISNIPLEAYDYVVNSKSALGWVMERQAVTQNSDTGIIDDANDYANETIGNPAYPLELFQRVITVSLETLKIVDGLPELDID